MDLYKKSTLDSKQSKNRLKKASTTQCVVDFKTHSKRDFTMRSKGASEGNPKVAISGYNWGFTNRLNWG